MGTNYMIADIRNLLTQMENALQSNISPTSRQLAHHSLNMALVDIRTFSMFSMVIERADRIVELVTKKPTDNDEFCNHNGESVPAESSYKNLQIIYVCSKCNRCQYVREGN